MVDTHFVDLQWLSQSTMAVVPLSDSKDSRYAGVLALPKNGPLQLSTNTRTDLYLLSGSLIEQEQAYGAGTFLCRGDAACLQAGTDGAKLFIYRDRVATYSGDKTVIPRDRQWLPGGAAGMAVALLSEFHHRVMLVSWMPGTRTDFHSHQRGEEIFVLQGELRDQRGRYPAGTWQRFWPGAGHAPYADTETLILLRNGHLTN